MEKAEIKSASRNPRKSDGELINLKFLELFTNQLEITKRDLSERLNLSRQAVYHWFDVDDIMLSQAINIVESFGYRLSMRLEPLDSYVQAKDIHLVTRKEDIPVGKGRLDYFRSMLKKNGWSIAKVADEFDMGCNAIYHWFMTGDCFVSYLYRMAALIDHKLVIDILPEEHKDIKEVLKEVEIVYSDNEYLADVEKSMHSFLREADRQLQGVKAAGQKARVLSLHIQKALVEYRRESVRLGKL